MWGLWLWSFSINFVCNQLQWQSLTDCRWNPDDLAHLVTNVSVLGEQARLLKVFECLIVRAINQVRVILLYIELFWPQTRITCSFTDCSLLIIAAQSRIVSTQDSCTIAFTIVRGSIAKPKWHTHHRTNSMHVTHSDVDHSTTYLCRHCQPGPGHILYERKSPFRWAYFFAKGSKAISLIESMLIGLYGAKIYVSLDFLGYSLFLCILLVLGLAFACHHHRGKLQQLIDQDETFNEVNMSMT